MADLEMRVSDREREAVAEQLREHAAEGRLDPDELEERLTAAYAARTRGRPVGRHPRGARRGEPGQTSHGVSASRRSGTRESGSTGRMRSAASGPATLR